MTCATITPAAGCGVRSPCRMPPRRAQPRWRTSPVRNRSRPPIKYRSRPEPTGVARSAAGAPRRTPPTARPPMIQSLLTVLSPASSRSLTTLAAVRDEIDVGADDTDGRLTRWITEESARIEARLGRVLVSEDVRQIFRLDHRDRWDANPPDHLRLTRRPVTAIANVVVDGGALETDRFEADAEAGLLFRLRGSRRESWCGRVFEVTYTGGYPSISTMPRPIEAACLGLIRHRWAARGRDPMLRSLAIPGVATEQYWVGSIGEEGDMPPEITALLEPYRNPVL